MKYIKLSFQYMKRRWLYMMAYSILPAIAFTFTTSPVDVFNTILRISQDRTMNFIDVWRSSAELNLFGFLFLLLSGIIFIVFSSALCGLMERDMRLGDLTNRSFFRRVNNNFLILFKIFFVFVLYLELYGVINASLIYLWYKVFQDQIPLMITFASISFGLCTIIGIMIACFGALWIPTMIMTGLNMHKSLTEALRLIKGKVWKFFLAVVLPIAPFYALSMISCYFDKIGVFNYLTSFLIYWFATSYYFVLIFVTYFDATGADREDLRKKIWEVDK